MQHNPEFSLSSVDIGGTFYCAGREYLVTDRERQDPSWLAGPPYALQEIVFDEDDFPALTLQPGI
jgi:hypothetical protein